MPAATSQPRYPKRVEWPTILLAAAIYLCFGILTWNYAVLPWWVLLLAGGYLVALQGSLQHEVVHGHPTPWPLVNEALVFPSLWLWLPFRSYRQTHLTHHNDPILTDPVDDPESYYVSPEEWARKGPLARGVLWLNNTLLGRLVLGPPLAVWCVLKHEIRPLLSGEPRHVNAWLVHLGGIAVTLVWVMGVCEIPFLAYVFLFAYPGLSLTLLRSYLEHQARGPVGERTVVVEAGPLFSLMFLNNNLHALHHAEPGLAWYRLPARYRERRAELLARNRDYRYRGYAEIFARYLLWPKEAPVYPLGSQLASAALEPVAGQTMQVSQGATYSPTQLP